MMDAEELIDRLISWDGSEEVAAEWVQARKDAIHREATQDPAVDPVPRLVGRCLDTLNEQLSPGRIDAPKLAVVTTLSPCDCAVIAFQTLWSFLGSAARRIGDYQLWDDVVALFSRYAPTLMEIAASLRGNGYSLSVTLPAGSGPGLELDVVEL